MEINQTVKGTPSYDDSNLNRKHFPISIKHQPISTRHSEISETHQVNTSLDEDTPYWENVTVIRRHDMVVTTEVTTCLYTRGGIPTVRLYGPQGLKE